MNAATAQVLPDITSVRRFEPADLTKHGPWLMQRLIKTYPHLNERAAINWLSGLVFNNEYLFLYQPHAVALAQVMSAHTLSGKPIVEERFVWVEDKEDKEQLKHAAAFYGEFHRWAKGHGVDVIVVEEMTDVPHELIKEHLGRLFTRQQVFARV